MSSSRQVIDHKDDAVATSGKMSTNQTVTVGNQPVVKDGNDFRQLTQLGDKASFIHKDRDLRNDRGPDGQSHARNFTRNNELPPRFQQKQGSSVSQKPSSNSYYQRSEQRWQPPQHNFQSK